MKLKSRQLQIPFGFRFVQPEIPRWRPRQFISFESLVREVVALRQGNSSLLAKGLPVDYATVADEVEEFNVRICSQMGWTSYITGDLGVAPVPKPMTPARSQSEVAAAANKAKTIWAGVRTLNGWLDSGEPAVTQAEAERRAGVCVACPLNGKGGLERFFTAPASEAIKRQFEKLGERKLATSQDDKLGICEGCYCPLKLKVFTPIHFIKDNLSDDTIEELRKGKDCWILAEL